MNGIIRQRLQTVSERNVRIRHIPEELDTIWAELANGLEPDQVVTRACMSNLIIYCDDDKQTQEIQQTLPEIVIPHPSRIVLLTGLGQTTEPGLDVFVSGLYFEQSSGVQVSAELIRVIADDTALKRLVPVARAHIIGDMPTTLWWASREPAPSLDELFTQLSLLSDQIIYDSCGWLHPVEGIHAMSRWVAAQSSEYVIYNLAWRRLKHWRGLLSQVLNPAITPLALSNVTAVKIDHGPHSVSMASLLIGWFASILGWQVKTGNKVHHDETRWIFANKNQEIVITLERVHDKPPSPQRVSWTWLENGSIRNVVFADIGDERLGIIESESDLPLRVVSAKQTRQGAMVAAQMAHRERDFVFEQSLALGNSMMTLLLK